MRGSEDKLLARLRDSRVRPAPDRSYKMPKAGALPLRPVVVGFGPAGMFAGLLLARAGLRPIVVERGGAVEDRQNAVQRFWQDRALDSECNVQFGEGGAGTFSDGKLNTGTKDERIFFVLQTLAEHGAPEEILFEAKPHIGTDRLPQTVRAIREEIRRLGGEVRFNTKMEDLLVRDGAVRGVVLACGGVRETLETRHVVLAIGHSARDTFRDALRQGVHPDGAEALFGRRAHRAPRGDDRPRAVRRVCGASAARRGGLQAERPPRKRARGLHLLHVPGRLRRRRGLRGGRRPSRTA